MDRRSGSWGVWIMVCGIVCLAILAGFADRAIAGDKQPGPNEFVAVEKMPEMTYQQSPTYPPEAIKKKIEGEVWVRALVDKEGAVRDAVIQKPSGTNTGFEKSALEAAKKCIYKAAVADGKPVAVWVSYKVTFALHEK